MSFNIIDRLYDLSIFLTDSFVTLHSRPTTISAENTPSSKVKPKSVAVLMQGPLLTKNDFTYQTLKWYRKLFPNQILILSTWKDEDEALLKRISQLGSVHVVLNDKPQKPGNQHINYQIVSATAGAKLAKKLKSSYLLKTRTDQRIHAPQAHDFLIELLKAFPVKTGLGQKMRIISSSLYSFKYRPYSVSDMFLFGQIDDLIAYLSPPLDERTCVPNYKNLKDYAKLRLGEMYFVTEFLKRSNHQLKWTLADSWQVYAERFCICDKDSLDIYWYKYDTFRENKFSDYGAEKNSTILSFKDWLILQATPVERLDAPEKTLTKLFTDPRIN